VDGHWRQEAIGGAKREKKTGVVTLLERFKSDDAAKTRSEVRKELGINGQYPYSYYYSILSYSRPAASSLSCQPSLASPGFSFN